MLPGNRSASCAKRLALWKNCSPKSWKFSTSGKCPSPSWQMLIQCKTDFRMRPTNKLHKLTVRYRHMISIICHNLTIIAFLIRNVTLLNLPVAASRPTTWCLACTKVKDMQNLTLDARCQDSIQTTCRWERCVLTGMTGRWELGISERSKWKWKMNECQLKKYQEKTNDDVQ